MDKELIAYFDERFHETSRQIQSLREETTQKFTSVTQQIASLREETTQQFTSATQQIASLREETTQHFEQVEDTGRGTLILVEHLRGEIKLVAEGVAAVDEKLEASVAELKQDIKEVQNLFTGHNKQLDRRVQVVEERTVRHTREIATLRRKSGKPRPS